MSRIVTVVAATIFSLWANFRVAKIEDAIQWILIILALLATTQLVDRFRLMRKLDEKVSGLVDAVGNGSGTTGLITDKVPVFPETHAENRSGIRLNPTVPTFGMWLFDINTDQAEIWVEIYSFREPEIFPTLHLLPVQDEKWFMFF